MPRLVGEQAVTLEHRADRGGLRLGRLHERQPQAAGVVAEQVQRRLGAVGLDVTNSVS